MVMFGFNFVQFFLARQAEFSERIEMSDERIRTNLSAERFETACQVFRKERGGFLDEVGIERPRAGRPAVHVVCALDLDLQADPPVRALRLAQDGGE